MKKFTGLLVAMCMLLMANIAFAGEKYDIAEGADITEIKSLALGVPLYSPRPDEEELTLEKLMELMNKASEGVKIEVVPYDTVTANLRRDKDIDFRRFNKKQSARVFRENVGAYADAYVILTVAKSKQSTFFFDVCKPGTANELLFTCQIQFAEKDSLDVYKDVVRKFYDIFLIAQTDQKKANQKAIFDKMKKSDKKEKKDKKGEPGFKKLGK